MTAIEKEADEVINLMRRSKMNDIRAYLIKMMKGRDAVGMNSNSRFIEQVKTMFTETSKTS